MKLPKAKNENILVQDLNNEKLVYDLVTNKAYCLNETSSIVYQACDGKTRFDDLKAANNLTDEVIYLAIDGLRQENLIEENVEYNSPFAGMTRREIVKKVGFASIVAFPVISSLVAPTPAMAQSGATACTNGGNPQGQGTCPGGQRCVGGTCSPCLANGEPLPGGCNVGTVARCCSSGCNVSSGICAQPPS